MVMMFPAAWTLHLYDVCRAAATTDRRSRITVPGIICHIYELETAVFLLSPKS